MHELEDRIHQDLSPTRTDVEILQSQSTDSIKCRNFDILISDCVKDGTFEKRVKKVSNFIIQQKHDKNVQLAVPEVCIMDPDHPPQTTKDFSTNFSSLHLFELFSADFYL
jgi:hypothetical protein